MAKKCVYKYAGVATNGAPLFGMFQAPAGFPATLGDGKSLYLGPLHNGQSLKTTLRPDQFEEMDCTFEFAFEFEAHYPEGVGLNIPHLLVAAAHADVDDDNISSFTATYLAYDGGPADASQLQGYDEDDED